MLATLVFEGAVDMAANAMFPQTIVVSNNNVISRNAISLVDAKRFYDGLSERDRILIPFDKMFWGDMLDTFEDKYCVQWMVHFKLN